MARGLGLKRGDHGSSQKSQRSNGSGGSAEKSAATTPVPTSPPMTLGPFPTNTVNNSAPSSPTTNLPIGPPISKGGTPPILVSRRILTRPVLNSFQSFGKELFTFNKSCWQDAHLENWLIPIG
jgi:hypothetical protein